MPLADRTASPTPPPPLLGEGDEDDGVGDSPSSCGRSSTRMPPSEGADARCRGRRGGTSPRDAGRMAPRMRRADADADDGVEGGAPLPPPAIVVVRRRTIAGWGWEEEEEKARADGGSRSRRSGRSSDDGGGGSARLMTLGWDVGGDDVDDDDDDDDDAALLMVSGAGGGLFYSANTTTTIRETFFYPHSYYLPRDFWPSSTKKKTISDFGDLNPIPKSRLQSSLNSHKYYKFQPTWELPLS